MVLPAPLAPDSRTISPAATSRSTPASAGKRPRRQTAERRRTTRHTRLRAIDDARVYERAPGAVEPAQAGPGAPRAAPLPSHAMRRFLGAAGRVLVTGGDPDPPVRGLPALGHRDPAGPGPERPPRPVRADAARRHQLLVVDDHHRRGRDPRPRPSCRPPRPAPPLPPTPAEGDAVAIIEIPKIGVDQVVVEGVERRRPPRRSRPLPGHAVPRPGRQRGDRRPPHDLRRTVRRHSTSWPSATRSCSAPSQGTFTYKVRRSRSR